MTKAFHLCFLIRAKTSVCAVLSSMELLMQLNEHCFHFELKEESGSGGKN